MMTAYLARLAQRNPKGKNIKEGGGHRPLFIQPTGFWGLAGFMPTAPGEWKYTWADVDCPVFKVVEKDFGIVATWRDVTRVYIDIPPAQVKDYLDDEILAIMRHAADIQDAPLDWQPAGEEIDIDQFMTAGGGR